MILLQIFSRLDIVSALCLVCGLAMLAAELLIPGVGFLGIGGAALLVVFTFIVAETASEFILLFSILFIVLAIFFIIFLVLITKRRLPKSILLSDDVTEKSSEGADKDGAEKDQADSLSDLVGKTGVALTVLRPAGCVEIDGVRYDVTTDGTFVPEGSSVSVMAVTGNIIKVKKV